MENYISGHCERTAVKSSEKYIILGYAGLLIVSELKIHKIVVWCIWYNVMMFDSPLYAELDIIKCSVGDPHN